MKDFEFKAYIKDLKKIVEVREIDFANKYITFRLNDCAKDEKRTFDQIELMQYIGLVDKNNVKIFDGFILNKEYDDYNETIIVEYGIWNCGCCYNVYGYDIDFDHNKNQVDCEVIGNVYENQELLKNKEK